MARVKNLGEFGLQYDGRAEGSRSFIDSVYFAANKIWRQKGNLTFDQAYEEADKLREEGKLWTVL